MLSASLQRPTAATQHVQGRHPCSCPAQLKAALHTVTRLKPACRTMLRGNPSATTQAQSAAPSSKAQGFCPHRSAQEGNHCAHWRSKSLVWLGALPRAVHYLENPITENNVPVGYERDTSHQHVRHTLRLCICNYPIRTSSTLIFKEPLCPSSHCNNCVTNYVPCFPLTFTLQLVHQTISKLPALNFCQL